MPIVDRALSSDEVQVRWVIYGLMEGVQRFSTLEITVEPYCARELCFPSWWIGHMLHGRGEVGGIPFEKLHSFKIGQTAVSQNWFAPYNTATSTRGILVHNTGPEVMVFKATFGWNAWPTETYPLIRS